MRWLKGRVAVPDIVGFHQRRGLDLLLTQSLPGQDLAAPENLLAPSRTVRLLAIALRTLHAADVAGCPFGRSGRGAVLIHGDACLPNILAADGTITGYVDVGEAGLGDRMQDIEAALWSIGHNIGPAHYHDFFDIYGMDPISSERIEVLRRNFCLR